MIESLRFQNYRVLRNTELPLGPFTLLVGPNGSGKSTVLHALRSMRAVLGRQGPTFEEVTSAGNADNTTSVTATLVVKQVTFQATARWTQGNPTLFRGRVTVASNEGETGSAFLQAIRTYGLDEKKIINPVQLTPGIVLQEDGANLAGVLDRIRDQQPESFEAYNQEIAAIAPEFDRVLFETPYDGPRGFMLRTKAGQHAIPARNLSQGTVLAMALLALTHLDSPPSMICIEEPDRGIHPRLYREIRDALYRLSYPEQYGLEREPVQVLITSHSPYMLDLHRDHPEEVVIAEKVGSEGTFSRLSDREDLDELLNEATLGEIWYSGVLGGVPAGT